MRTSMAYFAGAGTVLAAIVGGVGGGLLIADIVSPKSPKQELSRLERHVAQQRAAEVRAMRPRRQLVGVDAGSPDARVCQPDSGVQHGVA